MLANQEKTPNGERQFPFYMGIILDDRLAQSVYIYGDEGSDGSEIISKLVWPRNADCQESTVLVRLAPGSFGEKEKIAFQGTSANFNRDYNPFRALRVVSVDGFDTLSDALKGWARYNGYETVEEGLTDRFQWANLCKDDIRQFITSLETRKDEKLEIDLSAL